MGASKLFESVLFLKAFRMNHIKTSLFTESVGWAHHNPLLLYTLERLVVTFSTLSRFAVAAGFGRNAEEEHVAAKAVPGRQRHRPQRLAGASSGRRPGRWGRSTGAPGQLEDRLPRLGGSHSEAFWGCLDFESFDFDFDFGWIFCWATFGVRFFFLSCFQLRCPISQLLRLWSFLLCCDCLNVLP